MTVDRIVVQEWLRWFAVVALFCLALPLLVAALRPGSVLVLKAPDPLLLLKEQHLLLVIGCAEIAVSGFVALWNRVRARLLLMTWFSCNVLVYQYFSWTERTPGLGGFAGLTGALPVAGWVYNHGSFVCFGCMFVGSASLLVWEWLARRQSSKPAENASHGRNSVGSAVVT